MLSPMEGQEEDWERLPTWVIQHTGIRACFRRFALLCLSGFGHANVHLHLTNAICCKVVSNQQVLNLTPLNPTPATCHKRKRKLHCSFRSAALQELHCNIVFSAVRKPFGPKAALQQTKNCTATSKKLHCRKVALSCRFPADWFWAPTFRHPRLGPGVQSNSKCLKPASVNQSCRLLRIPKLEPATPKLILNS